MKKTFLMLGAFIVLAASCSKKDDDNTNKTKTDYLTTGNWKMVAATQSLSVGGVIDTTMDIFSQMEPCEKDNFITFKKDGAYISDEGATKCDPTDPQTETGSWTFTANETKLVVKDAGSSTGDTLNILQLDGSTLKVGMSDVFMGASATTTMTFSH